MTITRPRPALALLLGLLFLAGCGSSWETSYSDAIDPAVSKTWRVQSIEVDVPRTLSVSEANSYAPNADIVWREDPAGDRYAQVDKIVTEGVTRGVRALAGTRRVNILIEVQQFHALSQKARRKLKNSGVHNISFTAQIVDANTGQALSQRELIRADLIAYTGAQAREAESRGLTQRVRIVDHISKTIAGWLGTGSDVRGEFSRQGR